MPPLAAVTATITVQEPFAGIEPPVKVTLDAVDATVPPQLVPGVPAIVTPLGRVSVNGAVRLAAVAAALLKVIVRVEIPPASMVAGLKALPSVGGVGAPGGAVHEETATVLESIVTAPFRARDLPDKVALVLSVMLVSARIFPMNAVPVPIVAELPTCQKTLHCWAP